MQRAAIVRFAVERQHTLREGRLPKPPLAMLARGYTAGQATAVPAQSTHCMFCHATHLIGAVSEAARQGYVIRMYLNVGESGSHRRLRISSGMNILCPIT